jgi:hypothetical protein
MRRTAAVTLLAAALLVPQAATAATPKPFGQLECTPQEGVRLCSGRVATFDGVPIDLNVTLPKDDPAHAGPFPLMILSHGWGGAKLPLGSQAGDDVSGASEPWASRGYAVLSISSRGWGQSCGRPDSRLDPGCASGWIRLDDTRYEVRDVQHFAGLLVDDGLVDPVRIGVHGPSYGGGVSFALGVLRNRVMLPDDTLVPWRSPKGTQLSLAAAAPTIPWSDLVYSLTPNGRTLDYLRPEPRDSREPFGIEKQSYVSGLYAVGQATGFIAPPLADPGADLATWFGRINAGEPYEGDPVIAGIADEIYTHHSSIAIARTVAPAPMFVASGWTDDLFPVDEALRMRSAIAASHPGVPYSMMFFDFGHARGTGKAADMARHRAHVLAWMERYVRGDASAPAVPAVEALTQTCPATTASGGPFRAASWPDLHPGEVRFRSAPAKTLESTAGDPAVAQAIDPIAGDGACATTASADEAGTANWRLPAAQGTGYTLLGAPTVHADLKITGDVPAVAARLWDIGWDGKQTLVARGLYRPSGSGRAVFQLHPNAWRFEAGHVAKLQLLGRDAPYARPSNGRFSIEVSSLDLRLPVREVRGEAVTVPTPLVVPPGRALAPGYSAAAQQARARRARGKRLRLRVRASCGRARLVGADARRVRRVRFTRAGMRRQVDRRRPFRVRLHGKGRHVRAKVTMRGGRTVTLRSRVRRCR